MRRQPPPGDGDGVQFRGAGVTRQGRRVLGPVDLTLGRGVTLLVGANGAGKSTLLALAATVLRPTAGRVTVAGWDVADRGGRRGARASIGYLPQGASFPGLCTVAEAVAYAAWLHRVPSPIGAAVERALDMVDLGDERSVPLSRLSGGLRQRALLAQAVVHDPPIVLLDEPTVALDLVHASVLREQIEDIGSTRCVILTSHLVDDVARFGERVVILRSGEVAFDGPSSELVAGGEGPPLAEALASRMVSAVPC